MKTPDSCAGRGAEYWTRSRSHQDAAVISDTRAALASLPHDPYIGVFKCQKFTAGDARAIVDAGVEAPLMGDTIAGQPVPDAVLEPEREPLDAVEAGLVADWIRPTAGDLAVVFGPLETEPLVDGDIRIHLTFLGIAPATPARAISRHPQPLAMFARYLVTASASTGAPADRLIVSLAFAALERGVPDLERDGPTPDLWLALRVSARPALVVRALVERNRMFRPAPLVRQPLTTEWTWGRTLVGRVLGPGRTPIAGAMIEVPSVGLSTHSDHRGEFSIAGVPTGPPAPTLVITAKGVRLTAQAEASSSAPLEISVPLPES
jgi:hypothetical protein